MTHGEKSVSMRIQVLLPGNIGVKKVSVATGKPL
jgi:hypothetical protein